MKIERLFTYYLLAGTICFASCDGEVATDTGTLLPEGVYPLSLTATQGEPVVSPQTRVSDYEEGGDYKSKWTTGDQIKVIVSEGGNDMETTCTLDANGSITAYNLPLYWKTTQSSRINAWYSNITGQNTTSSTVSLADQSSSLAYVLKADEVDANYQSGNISLNFKHQLVKFRVKLEGTAENLQEAQVYFYSYTTCNNNQGTITTEGKTKDYLLAQKIDEYYTAMLAPDDLTKNGSYKFVKIVLPNNDAYYYNPNIQLEGGQVYTYEIKKVDKPDPILKNLSEGAVTITGNREYHITQNDTGTTGNSITITGSPTVYLKDLNISAGVALEIQSGTPTIILEGTNVLVSTTYGAAGLQLSSVDANVNIKGSGTLNATGAFGGGAGVGSANGGEGGNIVIEDCIIDAKSTGGVASAAGIGSGGPGRCGNITIRNATVTAAGAAGGAGIGAGIAWDKGSSCGNIEIVNSSIVATGSNYYNVRSATIGTGYGSECGNITISLRDGQTKDDFLKHCTGGNGNIGAGDSGIVGIITWKQADGTVIE